MDGRVTVARDQLFEGAILPVDGLDHQREQCLRPTQRSTAPLGPSCESPNAREKRRTTRRHGYLRSWLKTNEDGRYRFTTIRPGPYPGRTDPEHIHVTILEPDKPEYWIDSFVFDDDPRLTREERADQEGRGGSGIVSLYRDEDGIWRGERDIILEN